jgi:putative ABC transport system substrate-binding protein
MNNRRKLVIVLGVGALTAPFVSIAQQKARVYRIGILALESLESRGPQVEILSRAMRDYGYVEGKNLIFEARYANGDTSRLSALAAELVDQNPDIIVAPNGVAVQAAARAAAQAKRAIPIVFTAWATPVGSGLVASLARPGGNVTGMTNITVELAGKQLQLLKEALPTMSRVAVFVDSTTAAAAAYWAEVERASKVLGLQTLSLEVRGSDDVERNVSLLRKWRADAMFFENNPINFNNRKLLVQIAEETRLPAIYGHDAFTDIGGLMSYGSDYKLPWRKAALFADKILKGAKPGDLPIERPTTFDLVINLKTAKALGINIPQPVLVQATKVIE